METIGHLPVDPEVSVGGLHPVDDHSKRGLHLHDCVVREVEELGSVVVHVLHLQTDVIVIEEDVTFAHKGRGSPGLRRIRRPESKIR